MTTDTNNIGLLEQNVALVDETAGEVLKENVPGAENPAGIAEQDDPWTIAARACAKRVREQLADLHYGTFAYRCEEDSRTVTCLYRNGQGEQEHAFLLADEIEGLRWWLSHCRIAERACTWYPGDEGSEEGGFVMLLDLDPGGDEEMVERLLAKMDDLFCGTANFLLNS